MKASIVHLIQYTSCRRGGPQKAYRELRSGTPTRLARRGAAFAVPNKKRHVSQNGSQLSKYSLETVQHLSRVSVPPTYDQAHSHLT